MWVIISVPQKIDDREYSLTMYLHYTWSDKVLLKGGPGYLKYISQTPGQQWKNKNKYNGYAQRI